MLAFFTIKFSTIDFLILSLKKKKTKQKKQPHLKPFENAHFMNCSHQATRVAKFKMSPVPLFKREKKTFVF